MMVDSSDDEVSVNEVEYSVDQVEIKTEERDETVRKRGRPAKPDKPIKLPSIRGRGRPRKDGVPIPPEVPRVHSVGKRGRGRPMKLTKPKILAKIKATGLGRGRPPTKSSFLADIDRSLKPKVIEVVKKKGSRGRPRKQSNESENENENESEGEEPNRPGRPSTGGVKLHIIATGRGQGRPKKQPGNSRGRPRNSTVDVSEDVSNENNTTKRRGRPSLGLSAPSTKGLGRRGRPKKVTTPVENLPE